MQDVLKWFRHQYEIELYGSTILVAVGVILEGFEVIHEYREKLGPYKIHLLDLPKWMVRAAFWGWLFVSIGVAGEFLFESWLSTKNEELESISNALLADAQVSAADATKNADDARTSVHEAAKALGIVETRAAVLTGRIDAESSELNTLDAAITAVGPRRLSIGQQEQIGSACASLKVNNSPSNRIRVASYGLDGEGAGLGQQIIAALGSGGLYNNSALSGSIVSGGFNTGILISSPPENMKFATCFAHALREIGHLREVTVNGPHVEGGTLVSGGVQFINGASMQGGSRVVAGGTPLPAGEPVEIFVAIKPIDAATANFNNNPR